MATETYNAQNHISGAFVAYDAAGDITGDGSNQYIYDAEGTRVSKGTITNWSAGCDTTQNGFMPTSSYVIGPSDEQLAETDGSGNWKHTNVYAAGALIATYDNLNGARTSGTPAAPAGYVYCASENGTCSFAGQAQVAYGTNGTFYYGTFAGSTSCSNSVFGDPTPGYAKACFYSAVHFQFADWLGTRRVQTDYAGNTEETCSGLPFGNAINCQQTNLSTADDATEHHFTGKERDTESGLDYFGARYMSSNMGRFMSPDYTAGEDGADPIPYEDFTNPQSLNLYSYVRNNPLSHVDADGHDCVHINVDSGAYEGTDRGDCDNSTEEKANSGHYVDGTVDTINENRSGQVTGFSGTSYSGNLLSGAFASPLPYGPLEGPANQAGLNLLSNSAGVVNAVAGAEIDAAGVVFPGTHLAISVLSGRYQPGVQAAGISRKPGTLGQFGDNTRENKIARDIAKKLGLGKDGEEVVHGLLQEGSQMAEKPLTFTEGLNYVRQALGLIE
jgi:RHS repeat-associated protein